MNKPTLITIFLLSIFQAQHALSDDNAQQNKLDKAAISGIEDPLNIGQKRLKDADDLLKRITQNLGSETNIASITDSVLVNTLNTKPEEMAELTVEMMNADLNSDNSIGRLEERGKYFDALAKTTTQASKLVLAVTELQKNHDELDQKLEDGSETDKKFAEINERLDDVDQYLNALQNHLLKLNASVMQSRSEGGDMHARTNSASTNTDFKSQTQQKDIASKKALEMPLSVISTTISETVDGVEKGEAKVRLNSSPHPITITLGFQTKGFEVTAIRNEGIELTHISSKESFFIDKTGLL